MKSALTCVSVRQTTSKPAIYEKKAALSKCEASPLTLYVRNLRLQFVPYPLPSVAGECAPGEPGPVAVSVVLLGRPPPYSAALSAAGRLAASTPAGAGAAPGGPLGVRQSLMLVWRPPVLGRRVRELES